MFVEDAPVAIFQTGVRERQLAAGHMAIQHGVQGGWVWHGYRGLRQRAARKQQAGEHKGSSRRHEPAFIGARTGNRAPRRVPALLHASASA